MSARAMKENEEMSFTLLAINHPHQCSKALRRRLGNKTGNASYGVDCIAHNRVIGILGIVLLYM